MKKGHAMRAYVVLLMCAVTGCLMAASDPDQQELAGHLAMLEGKIATLEASLGQGHGAFRRGPTLRIDNGADESVLERNRRLTGELATASAALTSKQRELDQLKQQLTLAQNHDQRQNERLDVLKHAQDSLETAQQEVTDRGQQITTLKDQLAASELLRLRGERLYFLLASQVLKMQSGQAQELTDLQLQVRQNVQDLKIDPAPEKTR